jgi:hypothetical protein
VSEAVDGLELVPDEEELLHALPAAGGPRPVGDEIDQLALQRVRVLKLVDHDGAETERLALTDLIVAAQEVACGELEILEVERRFPGLGVGVRALERGEQILEEVAVANRERVQRSLLERLPGLLVAREPLQLATLDRDRREIEQPIRGRSRIEQLERPCRLCPRRDGGLVALGLDQRAPRRLAELLDSPGEIRGLAERKLERPTGSAQRLGDAGQHPPQPAGPVGRQEIETIRLPTCAERVERLAERFGP